MSIRTRVDNHVGIITLDRPQHYNAINAEMVRLIDATLAQWRNNELVQCLIFTSSGDKAFAAGADITELAELSPMEVLEEYGLAELHTTIAEYPKPTIAAIEGLALGGGFELALACDIRVAHPDSVFAFPELSLGILPGAGGTHRLADAAGYSVALHYILSGERLPAPRAYELGIVTALSESPYERALELAITFNQNGPVAQRLARAAVKRGRASSNSAIEELSQAVLFSTSEHTEGLTAFSERRAPNFRPSPKSTERA